MEMEKRPRLSREDWVRGALEVLRDTFERRLCDAVPQARVIGADVPRLPNTACIAFADRSSEAILVALNECGICASGGSACHSGSRTPSIVTGGAPPPWS